MLKRAKGINMGCKEFEKRIPDFINRRLDYSALKRFSEHMERCENCKEELEDGNAFDLQSELEQRLEEARRKIRFHGRILHFGIALEILAAVMLIGIGIWILL